MPMLDLALSLFAAAVLTNGSTLPAGRRQSIHETSEWSRSLCDAFFEQIFVPLPSEVDVECAWFTVPLDYADANVGTTRLAVIRSRATGDRKGSIFFNPGGPGENGVSFLIDFLPRLRADTGGDWDLVSFAPRSILPSGPEDIWGPELVDEYIRHLADPSFLKTGNLTTQEDADFLMSQVDSFDQTMTAVDESFVKYSGDKLKYIGTTAVIRDIAAMSEAFDGPNAKINYWGLSYGTIIGMELIQLFSERIGKLVLDGVVDPEYWTQKPPHKEHAIWISDAQEAYRGFTQVCAAAGPSKCALARAVDTADDVDARIQRAVNELQQRNPYTSGYSTISSFLLSTLYSPTQWSDCASIIADWLGIASASPKRALARKAHLNAPDFWPNLPASPATKIVNRQSGNDPSLLPYYRAFSAVAIACGDSVDQGTTTEQVFKERIRVSKEVSQLFGSVFRYPHWQCHRWSTRAVERYTGPWDTKPNSTVMVLGTEADPVAPFKSAKRVASAKFLGDSARLVQIWDFGHTSLNSYSPCLRSTLLSYLNEDISPEDKCSDDIDLICPTEISLMGTAPGIHWHHPVTSE